MKPNFKPGQAGHNPPATPRQVQGMLHRSIHPTTIAARPGPRPTEGNIGGRPPQHAKEWGPCQPHTRTPEALQHASCKHSRTAYAAAPTRPASPSTKAKPHPNHRTLPSQDPSVGTRHPPGDGPGTEAKD
ncbi:hypothetical protein ILYODFUR_029970 [Ilyodon furcidens]|uniref:Uncharacterized protein n=1 Tax=Ilyodon furcidens TaxID=33524 RepID=A0ABV0TC68_9TELE